MLYSLRAHRIKSNPKGSLARPPMSESQRITIQSHLEVAVWVKYVLPVMLLGGTLLSATASGAVGNGLIAKRRWETLTHRLGGKSR